jgi:RNA polymerase sigma-70 factor (ECF subfamily)
VEATDAQLIDAARSGDEAALEALIGRYQPRIFRFGMKMCRRPEEAAEVLQDTLIAMARTLKDFRGAASVSTWLYTIARSFCIKKRRRRKHAPEALVSLEQDGRELARSLPDPGRRPDELLESRELEAALERAIAALPPVYREVLILRDVEGLTAAEVGEVMGLSVEAVKSRLHRARGMVRRRLAPLLGLPAEAPAAGRRKGECPDIVRMFSRHLEGELSSGICARMEKHLEACAPCHDSCESLKRTLGLCRRTRAPEVPTAVQEAVRAEIRRMLVPASA